MMYKYNISKESLDEMIPWERIVLIKLFDAFKKEEADSRLKAEAETH